MIKTTNFSSFKGNAASLSPLALAFVGDGVFELLVRGNLINKHTIPVKKLHNMSVEQVNAGAQAKIYELIKELLNEEESEILRRGRNASPARIPKSTTSEDYHKATAVEALFGYLFLENKTERISQLFEVITKEEEEDAGEN